MLRLTLVNVKIHAITSHTHIFAETRSGTIEPFSLVPSDIVISIVRIRFFNFDVVINTIVSSNIHVFLILQLFLSRARCR
jgi:hypothetical protein